MRGRRRDADLADQGIHFVENDGTTVAEVLRSL